MRKLSIFACVCTKIMLLSQSNIDLPSWSSGSRRRPLTAETRVRFPMGVPNKRHILAICLLFYKHLMGIERADQCTIQRIVRPPRRDNEQKTAKHLYLYCFLRNCKFLICIAQTFCRCTENNQDVCLCRARNWYMSSGAIPYNEQKTAKHLCLC